MAGAIICPARGEIFDYLTSRDLDWHLGLYLEPDKPGSDDEPYQDVDVFLELKVVSVSLIVISCAQLSKMVLM